MNKILTFLLAFILLPAIGVSRAEAQDYILLTPFSKFFCGYTSDGKTQLAVDVGAGVSGKYKKVSLKSALDYSAKQKDIARAKQKRAAKLKKTLNDKKNAYEIIGELSKNQYEQIINFVPGGVGPTDQITGILAKLDQMIGELQAEIEYRNLERELIKDCEKGEPPPLSSLPISVEILMAQDLSSSSKSWYAEAFVYIRAPRELFPGFNTGACLTFQNGIKRLVNFNKDPFGAHDSQLSFASDHPLVYHGETARPLELDSSGKVTKLGYVVDALVESSGSSSKEKTENLMKSYIPAAVAEWGTVAQAARPKYNKKTKQTVCP